MSPQIDCKTLTGSTATRYFNPRFYARYIALLYLVLAGLPLSAEEQGVRIHVKVLDESGDPTPARAWVSVGGKQYFEPYEPATVTPYRQDQSFSCDGQFSIQVPAGDTTLHVEKGKEYRAVDRDWSTRAGTEVDQTVRLKRWVDMPARGWYSADLHIHLGQDNPRILAQLALADDVHLIPAFTYWWRGRGEPWHADWPSGVTTEPLHVDARHLVTRNNLEIERIQRDAPPGGTIGATFLFNLKRPVTTQLYGEHFPTDAELCRLARAHSPEVVFDSDKPSWAETVVASALGLLDTIQVCHNHYYRNSTGLGGYGMIGPLAAGESNLAAGDGLFHRTNTLYYRFLNCGFRLGVSGGSAIGVKAMPAGHHRVYAEIGADLSAAKMWQAIRAGRTFATTGPMLSLTANGQGIGSQLSLKRRDNSILQLQAVVESVEPLESLEIVHNGRVVAALELQDQVPSPVLRCELQHNVSPLRSGWLAARALFRAPDGLLRQAHTSPIYVEVDDQPIAFAEDARYMLRWLDRLEAIAAANPKHYPTKEVRADVLATYQAARDVYTDVLAQGEAISKNISAINQ